MTPIEQAIEALENVHNLLQSVDTCSRNNFSNLAAESIIEVQAALSALRGVEQQPKWPPCRGVPRAGCNYLAACDLVCNKCGQVHRFPTTPPTAPVLSEAEIVEIRKKSGDIRNTAPWAVSILFARAVEAEVLRRAGGGV